MEVYQDASLILSASCANAEKVATPNLSTLPQTPIECPKRKRMWHDLDHSYMSGESISPVPNSVNSKSKVGSCLSHSARLDRPVVSRQECTPILGFEKNVFFQVANKKTVPPSEDDSECKPHWYVYSVRFDLKFLTDSSTWGSYVENVLCSTSNAAFSMSEKVLVEQYREYFRRRRDALRSLGMTTISKMKSAMDSGSSYLEHFSADLIWCNNSCALDAFLSLIPVVCGHLYSGCPEIVVQVFFRSTICSVLGILQFVSPASAHSTRLYYSNAVRLFLVDGLIDSFGVLENEDVVWSLSRAQPYLDLGALIEFCIRMFFEKTSHGSNFVSYVLNISEKDVGCFDISSSLAVEMSKFIKKRCTRSGHADRLLYIRFPTKLPAKVIRNFESLVSKNWNGSSPHDASVIGMMGYSSSIPNHFVSLVTLPNDRKGRECYLHDGMQSNGIMNSVSYRSLSQKSPMKWLSHVSVVYTQSKTKN